MNISVILAARNEEENIKIIVPALLKSYDKDILEVIVVNDNSTDNTQGVTEELMEKYKKVKLINRTPPGGVGRALKEGFCAVDKKADYVLTMDSDFINNVPDVNVFIEKANQGYDVVIGSRYIPGGKLVNYPALKKFANRTYHFIVRHVMGIPHRDLTNNFKLFKTEVVKKIKWKSNDFAINAETGLFPYVRKYKMIEVPVAWIERSYGRSHFKVLKLGPSYLKVMFRVMFQKRSI
jgi:dolichol-phosphate mannosyltransferase